MVAIYKKEIKSYFTSITGYVFIAFVIVAVSIYSMAMNFAQGVPNFEYSLASTNFIFTITIPILTMRVIAEERKQKTDSLLYSLPLSMTEIVFGKYFAMLSVFAIPVVFMLSFPAVLSLYGKVNFINTISSLVGYFLLGSTLIAIGLLMSSLTENQVVAAALCFGSMLLIFLMSTLAWYIPASAQATTLSFSVIIVIAAIGVYFMTKNVVAALVAAVLFEVPLVYVYLTNAPLLEGQFQSLMLSLSAFVRLSTFINGIFDLTAVVYYLSLSGLFLFFTIQSMEKRRWS